MALSRWQSSIVDQQGNIQPFAELVVLNEETQGQAALFHDREGNSPISGNVVADEDGYAYFYASAGRYRIQSVALDIDWRDVEVGVTGDAELNDLTVGGDAELNDLTVGGDANFSSMPVVGGSPIVSSGETNAGSWVQYADGTIDQIVMTNNPVPADESVGSIFRSGPINVTFPKPLSNTSTLIFPISRRGGGTLSQWATAPYGVNSTSATVRAASTHGDATVYVGVFVRGKVS